MSVSSIGQSGSDYWLQQLLASYGQSSSTDSQSSILSLLSQGSDATDATSATSSGSSTSSSVGSFNDILAALLSSNGSLSYDMETGSLTTAGQGEEGEMPPPMDGAQGGAGGQGGEGGGLSRSETVTKNDDGSTTTSATLTDASGNQVGTEKTVENADGSYSTTITMTDPSGKTSTRTITGENTTDGFKETQTLTAADGTVLETGTILTAADGSVTTSMTRNGPDGGSMTQSASYDAEGNLVSSTSSSTAPTITASADSSSTSTSSDSTSTSTASGTSSSSSSSSGASSGSSSSDSSGNTTTVTMAFTSEGIEETTTVTDADGNLVSQSTKEIPFSSTAQGSTFGSSLTEGQGLSDLIGQYAANRYGAGRYAEQQGLFDLGAQQSGLSVDA